MIDDSAYGINDALDNEVELPVEDISAYGPLESYGQPPMNGMGNPVGMGSPMQLTPQQQRQILSGVYGAQQQTYGAHLQGGGNGRYVGQYQGYGGQAPLSYGGYGVQAQRPFGKFYFKS